MLIFSKLKIMKKSIIIFFRKIYLTKTKTAEKDTKDTSTHISQCNSLSLKEKEHNVGLYIVHITLYKCTCILLEKGS